MDNRDRGRRDDSGSRDNYMEKLVKLNRTAKVVKGGRSFSFSALTVVGDRAGMVGFGFGKAAEHNLAAMRELPALRRLGRPVLLGTSRKSTLGRVLGGLPVEERLEATLATTALAIAGGVDIVRVHDVRANVRAALVADAICRGEDR